MTTLHRETDRYASLLIIIHWIMAGGIFFMFGSGVVMTYAELTQDFQFRLYQWHKASGILIMLALGLRIVTRLSTFTPPLPVHFPKIEVIAAKLGHVALYGGMVLMVASGWIMVSSSSYGLPTLIFGWFSWPHIPGLAGNLFAERTAYLFHFWSAIALGLFLLGHIAAVIKHRLIDKENLLTRLWWRDFSFKYTLLAFVGLSAVVILFTTMMGETDLKLDQAKLSQMQSEQIHKASAKDHSYVLNM
ncbi:MAG: cytochrome b, partial [Pseudomonadota bacterium]